MNWIKEKLNVAWRWTRQKVKSVLIFLGVVTIVLAAGTQLDLGTYDINYPTLANTDTEKVEFIYQTRGVLRLEHNEMGRKYRDGEISEGEFRDYQENYYKPKVKILNQQANIIGERLVDIVIATTTSTTTGKTIEVKVNARQYIKKEFIDSDKWNVNLNTIF